VSYQVEIEVALRGARELKVLKDSLKGVNKEVGKLNAATIKAGKALKGTFSAKDIGNVNNYSKAVAKAERALRNAAFGTEAEKKAVKALVTAQKEFNEQLDRQNKLLREEERLQGVNQPAPKAPKTPKTRRPGTQTFGVSGIDFMPIGGGEFVPGSPLFKQGLQRRAGAAVSAGAFPLLFGGGPGMAVGGALGGAISGSTFGPASIALQVLGGVVDELAVKAAGLGAALSPATADIDALVDSLGLVGSPTQDAIKSIRDLAGEEVALEEATRQLALLVGDEGVTALTEFGDASTRFGNALTQITTLVLAQIARLAKGPLAFAANAAEFAVLFEQAQVSKDPRLTELQNQLRAVEQPVAGGFTPTSGVQAAAQSARRQSIANDMVEIMKDINKQETERINKLEEAFRNTSAQNVIANNNLKISELHADITNDQVYALEQSNIKEKAKLALLKDGADEQLIELERKTALNDLENKRNDLIERANDKAEKALKRQSDAADRLAKKQQRERERAAAAFERQEQQLIRLQLRGEAQREREVELAGQRIDKYSDQLRLLEAQINGTEDQVRLEIDLANAAGEVERNYVKRIFAAKQTLKQLEEQRRVFEAIGDTIKTGVVDGITAAIDQTRTLGEVASNVLRTIANQLLRLGVNQVFSAFNFGGGGGGGGSTGPNVDLVGQYMGERALGGSVSSGRPYMVGERGPELFVPGAQGNIIPNNAMGSTSVVVNVDASGTEVQGNQGNADQLGRLIGQAVQAELIKQKRPGGLLTR
jgi:hypothetical protein